LGEEKMNKLPWNKTIPRQMAIDDFSGEGVKCPYCGQYKQILVSIVLAEGMDYICEECRKHETLADLFRPPSQKEFAKRIKSALEETK
jgi:transposase-like protein